MDNSVSQEHTASFIKTEVCHNSEDHNMKRNFWFYGNRKFITEFTLDPILSHMNPVTPSHPVYQKFVFVILSSNLCVRLPSEFFAWEFQTGILYASRIFLKVLHEPCISFSLVWTIYNNVQAGYQLWRSFSHTLLHFVASSAVFPLSSLFSNCSFHGVRGRERERFRVRIKQ
jgi:hypothetical protein